MEKNKEFDRNSEYRLPQLGVFFKERKPHAPGLAQKKSPLSPGSTPGERGKGDRHRGALLCDGLRPYGVGRPLPAGILPGGAVGEVVGPQAAAPLLGGEGEGMRRGVLLQDGTAEAVLPMEGLHVEDARL